MFKSFTIYLNTYQYINNFKMKMLLILNFRSFRSMIKTRFDTPSGLKKIKFDFNIVGPGGKHPSFTGKLRAPDPMRFWGLLPQTRFLNALVAATWRPNLAYGGSDSDPSMAWSLEAATAANLA